MKDLENLVLEKQETEYKPSQILESKEFEFVYNYDAKSSFSIDVQEGDIIIEKRFICGKD